jgi:ribosomal protein S18 acetylase RimI-like enzyme
MNGPNFTCANYRDVNPPVGTVPLACQAGKRMSESCFVLDIDVLVPAQWQLLKEIRLTALYDSPRAFLATYDEESAFDDSRWLKEFDRGSWLVGRENERAVSLLGCTRLEQPETPEFYLEFLWVSPDYRQRGIAYRMIQHAVERLRAAGVLRAFLWVLDGNDAAVRLYRRAGFVSSNHREPLPRGRSEERMQLDLG